VQIDFGLHPILAASQLAKNGRLHALAMEDELFPTGDLMIPGVGMKALLEYGEAVRAGKVRTRGGFSFAQDWSLICERLDVSYRFTEEQGIVVIRLGVHATSAESSHKTV
jgi:hypothetical protein